MREGSATRVHGGAQGVYRHASTATDYDMTFSVFVLPHVEDTKPLVICYPPRLICAHANVAEKGEFRVACAKLGLIFAALVGVSPRGDGVSDDLNRVYDFGLDASFYVDAIQEPYVQRCRMWSYVTDELPALVTELHEAACEKAGIALSLHIPGHDHSYYSISSFMAEQLPWHAGRLGV